MIINHNENETIIHPKTELKGNKKQGRPGETKRPFYSPTYSKNIKREYPLSTALNHNPADEVLPLVSFP